MVAAALSVSALWHWSGLARHAAGQAEVIPASPASPVLGPGQSGPSSKADGPIGSEQAQAPPATTPAAYPDGSVAVPDVVGQRLSGAVAALRGAGLSDVEPVDGSGLGRVVLNADNWIVKEQRPTPGEPVPPGSRITLTVTKPTDTSSGGAVSPGVMPKVVCGDLQAAQDALQAAGFHNLASTDGLGLGRMQILDRDWVVIAQSLPPGKRAPAGTRVVLSAVKYGEDTGGSGCRS